MSHMRRLVRFQPIRRIEMEILEEMMEENSIAYTLEIGSSRTHTGKKGVFWNIDLGGRGKASSLTCPKHCCLVSKLLKNMHHHQCTL